MQRGYWDSVLLSRDMCVTFHTVQFCYSEIRSLKAMRDLKLNNVGIRVNNCLIFSQLLYDFRSKRKISICNYSGTPKNRHWFLRSPLNLVASWKSKTNCLPWLAGDKSPLVDNKSPFAGDKSPLANNKPIVDSKNKSPLVRLWPCPTLLQTIIQQCLAQLIGQ